MEEYEENMGEDENMDEGEYPGEMEEQYDEDNFDEQLMEG